MAKSNKHNFSIMPAECLALLPEIPLDTSEGETEAGLRRAELRHSVLTIAELNHVTETAMVRAVMKNVLGRLPDLEE